MKRIDYIDGLKGFSALTVLLGHFCCGFLPEIFTDYNVHLPEKISIFLYRSPLRFFVNGQYMVYIFCTLSAFFVCLKVLNTEDKKKILLLFPKRYLRIVLPLIPMSICVYIFSRFNLFFNRECALITKSGWLSSFYQNPLSIKETVLYTFYNTPFLGDMSINAVLWMIPYILLGSIIAILIGANYSGSPYVTYILILISFLHYYRSESLYVCAVVGSALAILYNKTKDIKSHKVVSFVSFIAISIGFLIGGYSYGAEHFKVYSVLSNRLSYWHINIIGSTMYIIGVMYSSLFMRLFSVKPFLFLGKISFSVYIVHLPVICSVSSFCFIKMNNWRVNYLQSMFTTLVVTIITTFGLSSLYYKYIEINCNKLIKRVLKY